MQRFDCENSGVLNQRLVRKLCEHCKESYTPSAEQLAEIGLELGDAGKLWANVGCSECSDTGYKGRTGIYELLLVDDEIRDMVTRQVDASAIKRRAVEKGLTTLRDDGAREVIAGTTTIAEVLRVTQVEMVAIEDAATEVAH